MKQKNYSKGKKAINFPLSFSHFRFVCNLIYLTVLSVWTLDYPFCHYFQSHCLTETEPDKGILGFNYLPMLNVPKRKVLYNVHGAQANLMQY